MTHDELMVLAATAYDRLQIELDAGEFCRILSGRGTASGLLTQGVAF